MIMRPTSIRLFEKLLFAGLGLSLLSMVINWQAVTAVVRDPRLAALDLGEGFVIGSVAISFAIYLLLWYFIARRASTVAKWTFVFVTGINLLNFVSGLGANGLSVGLVPLLGIVALALQVYAAWLLFRPDAQAWFNDDRGNQAGPIG